MRLTIALNAKQTQKSIVVMPSSTGAESVRAFILDAAVKKLRAKKPSRVFLHGGRELSSPEDFQETLKDDVLLLISMGEEYVGNIKETPLGKASKSEVRVLAHSTPVEAAAIKQLEVASELPGVLHAVGQPDLHEGNKFPIGCVLASRDWIHPPLIGGDIGCGISWYKTTLNGNHVAADPKKVAERLKGLEGAWMGSVERSLWLGEYSADAELGITGENSGNWDEGIGTIGKGNHFAEVQIIESIDKPSEGWSPPFEENSVVLLVHSGSRWFGQSVLKMQPRISMPVGSNEANEYLRLHDKACAWARKNRDLIALRFLQKLEATNDEWSFDVEGEGENEAKQRLADLHARIQNRKVVDVWHNNVEKVSWPPNSPTDGQAGETFEVFIHRKGAAPATPTNYLLPLPGSRGTPTLLLRPIFGDANKHGLHNLLSVAHGAGRSLSRSKAANLSKKYKNNVEEMTQRTPTGGIVLCEDKELVWEEAPEAYKDVEQVAEDLVREGTCLVVGRAIPKISYKVRKT